MLVVNPHHWLTDQGDIPDVPSPVRRGILRVARLIEYGGPLEPGHARETLVECGKRLGGRRCSGFLWVEKQPDDTLLAHCLVCRTNQVLIHDWQDTIWATGPCDPVMVAGHVRQGGVRVDHRIVPQV